MLTPITGFEGYSITSFGDVISFRRYPNGRKLSPYIDKDGYECIKLIVNGSSKGFKIHRLVAMTYIVNPNNLLFVNHIDGNKLNNHYSNLEWISNTENQRHAWRTELKKGKLSLEQVGTIKTLLTTKNNTEIARLYNVDPSTISNIRTGRTWNKIFGETK